MSSQPKSDPWGTGAASPDHEDHAFSDEDHTEAAPITDREGRRGWAEPPLDEVGLRELARTTARILARVEHGERMVVTRQARPIALLISVDEARHFFAVHAAAMVQARIDARREYRGRPRGRAG